MDFMTNGCFYEESARMPFVIRYPKCIPAGKRVNELVLNVDFASTLCDFAGVKFSGRYTGQKFLKMFWQEKSPKDWRKSFSLPLLDST